MATYDNPMRITHNLDSVTVSSSDSTKSIKGPAGHSGVLRDVLVRVTTTTAGATTTPIVNVGESGALTKYASFNVGAQTAPEALAASGTAKAIKTESDGRSIFIDPNEEVLVTFVAATGSGAAGVIEVDVVIDWFN